MMNVTFILWSWDFFAILGRGLRAFQIEKISVVKPLMGKFVIAHNYVIFGQPTNQPFGQ